MTRVARALRFGPWLLLVGLVLLGLFWLRPPRTACGGAAPPAFAAPRVLPSDLRGARVMLNPGHGLTQSDAGTWAFQRSGADGRRVFVLEDDSNLFLARAVRGALEAAGAVVLSTRDLGNDTLGESGQPLWREASTHYLEQTGAPRGVWASAGPGLRGDCRAGQDLRARAYAANVEGADVLLSLHSNAGRPDARGTAVIYSNRAYLSATSPDLEPRSACLARQLARSVPDSIRAARADLRWPRAAVTASDRYGENGYALMPAVILEVGFHTNAVDGAALGQASFRRALASGVVAALERFFAAPACQ